VEHKPLTVEIRGKTKRLYRFSMLASQVGRSIHVVDSWIRAGSVPPTPFRTKRGDRLYTDGMIVVVREAVGSRKTVGSSKAVYKEIVKGWSKLGIKIGPEHEIVLT
jgi:hypothetical protein